jgi:type II secretory pathway component PulM
MLERLRLPDRLTAVRETLLRMSGQAVARLADLTDPLRPYYDRAVAAARPAWDNARAYYEHREPREKLLLRIAGTLIGVFLLYAMIYLPIVGWRDSVTDAVSQRRQDLIDVRKLMVTYNRLQTELAAAQQRTVPNPKTFSLFSILEQTLTRSITRDHIGSITPSDHEVAGGFRQYTVDVKLSAITLDQVVDVLYGIQTLPNPVAVSSLQLREDVRNSHSFDADMTCVALAKDG